MLKPVTYTGTIGPMYTEVCKQLALMVKALGAPETCTIMPNMNDLFVILPHEHSKWLREAMMKPEAAEGRVMRVNGVVTDHWRGKM